MKVCVRKGKIRLTLYVSLRFGLWIAKIACGKNAAFKKVLRLCKKDVLRELKRYKRRNASLTLAEIESADGAQIFVRL